MPHNNTATWVKMPLYKLGLRSCSLPTIVQEPSHLVLVSLVGYVPPLARTYAAFFDLRGTMAGHKSMLVFTYTAILWLIYLLAALTNGPSLNRTRHVKHTVTYVEFDVTHHTKQTHIQPYRHISHQTATYLVL